MLSKEVATGTQLPSVPGVQIKPVEGFSGYAVGDDGSVWSRFKPNGYGGGHSLSSEWKRLKPSPNQDGHHCYRLYRDGTGHHVFAHALVLTAFVGPRPPGLQGCHGNGNPAVNALWNLRWDTQRANAQDAIRHGARPRGSAHGRAVVTEEDIPVIRRLVREGSRKSAVGRMYGMSPQNVDRIVKRKLWSHVPG